MPNPQPSPTPSTPSAGWLAGQIARLRGVYDEYPRQFWVLVFGSFIDRLGGALLFPFFSLYITQKFNVGMTQVGVIFAVFSITGLFSSMLGGALTDRIGRKGIIIFGLLMSALSALVMGLVNEFTTFLVVAGVVGLLSDVGWPAQSAMVADLLPEPKRAQGFGILRVVFNLAVVIGPLLGGLLASRSYLLLFIIDTITSLITAGFVWVAIRETRAAPAAGEPQESPYTVIGIYGVTLFHFSTIPLTLKFIDFCGRTAVRPYTFGTYFSTIIFCTLLPSGVFRR